MIRKTACFDFAAAFAGLVACMGLFGLAAFTAERRTKEIGIRKIMGARVSDIVGLLILQFSVPVLAANLIAWPIALFAVQGWLSAFVYRIDLWTLGPLVCAAAGVSSLVIAWVTVGGHVVGVARTRPVSALRS